MEDLRENECRDCVFLVFHDTYEYLGICEITGEVVITTDKACENFAELTIDELKKLIDERKGAYCLTCKTDILTFEELKEHLEHHLAKGVFSDEVAPEEAPAGD